MADPFVGGQDQERIDEVVAVGSGTALRGNAAVALLQDLVAETVLEVSEYPEWDWRPGLVGRIADDLEPERARELALGAPLTSDEEGLWAEATSTVGMVAEIASVRRIVASNGAEAWFVLVRDGNHQGATELDGAGPFTERTEAIAWTAERARGWFGWWCPPLGAGSDAARLRNESEALIGKPAEEL